MGEDREAQKDAQVKGEDREKSLSAGGGKPGYKGSRREGVMRKESWTVAVSCLL